MTALERPSKTSTCEECSGTTRLITVIHGRDDKPAWLVFKCDDCGFYNWMTPLRPRAD